MDAQIPPREKNEKPAKEDIRAVYQECCTLARFIAGLRFSFFASFSTFFFVLIGSYHYVWISPAVFKGLQPHLLVAISLFGFIGASLGWFAESRTVFLYRACDHHAAVVERDMKIHEGIRQFLVSPRGMVSFFGIPVTHAFVIKVFYGTWYLVWLALFLISVRDGFFLLLIKTKGGLS